MRSSRRSPRTFSGAAQRTFWAPPETQSVSMEADGTDGAVVTFVGVGAPWQGKAWAAALAPVDRFMERYRIPIVVTTGLVALIGTPLLFHLRFDFNPLNLRNPGTPAMRPIWKLALMGLRYPWTGAGNRAGTPRMAAGRPAILHYLYGAVFPALVIGVCHLFTRGLEKPPYHLFFTIGSFFVFGLTARALMTGLGLG